MVATLGERDVVFADDDQLDQARQVMEALPQRSVRFTADVDGRTVELPRELSAIVGRMLRVLADGGTVTVGAMPEELTTTTAAAQLGVSRPTLVQMVKAGEIKAHKVGTHLRLRTADVMRFKEERLSRQRAGFERLRELEGTDED